MSGSASCEPDGTPYIEVHHIIPLCEGAEDGVWNLSVLCAHHHRMAHFADDTSKKQIRNFLQKEVDKRVGRKGDREMAELEEYPKNGTLEEKVQWIRNINADSLLHSDKSGQTFAGPIDKFKKVQALLHRLNIPEVEEVAQMSRINFMDHIEGIRDKIVVINNPDLNPKDAGTIAEHSQSQFTQIMNQMSEQLSPYLLLISPPPTQTESADLILIKEEATKTLEDVHDIHEQVMHAAENITSQAAHTGVAVKARGFDEEYKKHVSASKI